MAAAPAVEETAASSAPLARFGDGIPYAGAARGALGRAARGRWAASLAPLHPKTAPQPSAGGARAAR